MAYNENAREPFLDSYDADRETARQKWEKAVNDYEDGLTDVEPPTWKEFWG